MGKAITNNVNLIIKIKVCKKHKPKIESKETFQTNNTARVIMLYM